MHPCTTFLSSNVCTGHFRLHVTQANIKVPSSRKLLRILWPAGLAPPSSPRAAAARRRRDLAARCGPPGLHRAGVCLPAPLAHARADAVVVRSLRAVRLVRPRLDTNRICPPCLARSFLPKHSQDTSFYIPSHNSMKLAIFALFIGAAAALRTQSISSIVASKLKEDLNVTKIISEEEVPDIKTCKFLAQQAKNFGCYNSEEEVPLTKGQKCAYLLKEAQYMGSPAYLARGRDAGKTQKQMELLIQKGFQDMRQHAEDLGGCEG